MQSIYNVLHRVDIPGKKPITSHDIKAFFNVSGFRVPIMEGTALACKEATVNLNDFESFDVRHADYLAKLTSILSALIAEPLVPAFQQSHMDYILALGDTLVSRVTQINNDLEVAARVNNTTYVPFTAELNDITAEIWAPNGTKIL